MMTIYSDTFHWSGITPIFDHITDLDLITELPTLCLIASGFHRTFAAGAACQQETLTPPDTWSCPTLGLASVLMLRPISRDFNFFLIRCCPPPPVIHNFPLIYFSLHVSCNGSCVSQGEQHRIRKKLKSLYILSNKYPDGHKNLY